MLCFRCLSERATDLENDRKKRSGRLDRIHEDGFVLIDAAHDHFYWDEPIREKRFFAFNLSRSADLLDIFLHLITPQLLNKCISNLSKDKLIMGKKHPWVINYTVKIGFLLLAIMIRIYGLQNRPLQNTKNDRPLRANISEAITHFLQLNPSLSFPSMSVLEKLMSIPLFTYHYFEEISLNCQSVVRHLGEYVAGDEKLFHFTGDSGDIRLVLTKPDRIGLWFYQLCAPLHNGASFLLWFKLHHSDAFLGENIPVASVVPESS
jgi:hypothetical protein